MESLLGRSENSGVVGCFSLKIYILLFASKFDMTVVEQLSKADLPIMFSILAQRKKMNEFPNYYSLD